MKKPCNSIPFTTLLFLLLYSTVSFGQNSGDVILYAIELREAGFIDKSISTLTFAAEENPKNLRLKVELATSHFQNKDFPAARKLVNEVLASRSLPNIVRDNIKQFLNIIELRQNQDNSSTSMHKNTIRVLLGSDSNANIAPSDTNLDIGTLPEESTATSDHFKGITYDYLYATPTNINLHSKNRSIYNFAGFSAYNKDYDDVDNSDVLALSARMGARYIPIPKIQLQGDVSITHIELDRESLVDFYRIAAKTAYQFDSYKISFLLSSNQRAYIHDEDDGKEGQYIRRALGFETLILDKWSVFISLGEHNMNLDERHYSYRASEITARLNIPLGTNMDIGINSQHSLNRYLGLEEHYDVKRKDTMDTHKFQITYNDVFTDLDGEIAYIVSNRESNNDIHSYDRRQLLFSMKYVF